MARPKAKITLVANRAASASAAQRVTAKTRASLNEFREELIKFLKGKDVMVDALMSAILASGHILLEDVPGVGKTTLIKAVAQLLGLEMKRIQCTSDLLPSDIIGVEVYNSSGQDFVFHQGPLFANIILADELNRASPRTQSALLEAMGEGFVTVDRRTYELPKPFVVFASQNPSDYVGTYPLPEAQLDRFSVKLHLNYPSLEKERQIFQLSDLDPLKNVAKDVLSVTQLREMQNISDTVTVSDRIADYVKRFVDATRKHEGLKLGVSTRGGVIWVRLARARAALYDRDYVSPDDLLALGTACLGHRVLTQGGTDGTQIIESLLGQVDIDG